MDDDVHETHGLQPDNLEPRVSVSCLLGEPEEAFLMTVEVCTGERSSDPGTLSMSKELILNFKIFDYLKLKRTQNVSGV